MSAPILPAPEQLLDALDPEQREVALALSGPVAVIAGAGTGKTRAITHRIAYGARVGAYVPNQVLAVTFTTRAAGEMRGRLQQLGVRGVQARTFHSAALRQAQYFWPRVYRGDLPQILDNRFGVLAEAARRLRVGVDTAKLRDLSGEISWSKVSNVTAADYPGIARATRREVSGLDPDTIGRVFAGYEQLKNDRGRIDFEDILLCTVALLSDHPEILEEVRRTYRHLVVDEYQDVSPLQETLLDLWVGERGDLCVVGDPAQTIHSFAGARSDYLTGFARKHRRATVVRLVRDYRSTHEVVEVANRLMRPSSNRGELTGVTLQAQAGHGPEPVYVDSGDEPTEAAGIAQWLRRQHEDGIAYREMAVLFRINAQSPALEQALSTAGVPYLVRSGERFYERPEVRQALGQLRTQARATADPDVPTGDQVRAVLSELGWTPQAPTGAGATRERWESLAALVQVADDVLAALPRATLADVVEALTERANAQHVPQAEGVTLSTIHAAKGLEWDAVAVSGVHEGTLPFVLATSAEEIAEERRLLYVAITRARQRLRISWSRKPSRFLDGLRPGDVESARAGRRVRPKAARTPSCRVCGEPLTQGADRKLGRHLDCPSSYDESMLELLKEWRKQTAEADKVPAYVVFTDATLIAIAEAVPQDHGDLLRLRGIGQAKLTKYGEEVLAVVRLAGDRNAEGTD
nr:ATP-dependent DNA helicase UvrD2 [Granulicoccus phenolivorans]